MLLVVAEPTDEAAQRDSAVVAGECERAVGVGRPPAERQERAPGTGARTEPLLAGELDADQAVRDALEAIPARRICSLVAAVADDREDERPRDVVRLRHLPEVPCERGGEPLGARKRVGQRPVVPDDDTRPELVDLRVEVGWRSRGRTDRIEEGVIVPAAAAPAARRGTAVAGAAAARASAVGGRRRGRRSRSTTVTGI